MEAPFAELPYVSDHGLVGALPGGHRKTTLCLGHLTALERGKREPQYSPHALHPTSLGILRNKRMRTGSAHADGVLVDCISHQAMRA